MFATKGGITSSPFTGVLAHLTGAAGPSGFGASSTAEQVAANWDGTGKVVLITGANTGEPSQGSCFLRTSTRPAAVLAVYSKWWSWMLKAVELCQRRSAGAAGGTCTWPIISGHSYHVCHSAAPAAHTVVSYSTVLCVLCGSPHCDQCNRNLLHAQPAPLHTYVPHCGERTWHEPTPQPCTHLILGCHLLALACSFEYICIYSYIDI